MKFGSDWTGVFIRGDDSFGYKSALEVLLKAIPDDQRTPAYAVIAKAQLEGLVKLLEASREHLGVTEEPQRMLDYDLCAIEEVD